MYRDVDLFIGDEPYQVYFIHRFKRYIFRSTRKGRVGLGNFTLIYLLQLILIVKDNKRINSGAILYWPYQVI